MKKIFLDLQGLLENVSFELFYKNYVHLKTSVCSAGGAGSSSYGVNIHVTELFLAIFCSITNTT